MLPFIYIFNIIIPMYGLCICSGILFASFWAVYRCKKQGLIWEDAVIIGITGLGIGLIGAKVMYILITFPLSSIPSLFVSGKLIADGGFVFYGGLLGGIIGAFAGGKLANAKVRNFEHILIPVIPLVHAFGRIGCLMAGCCYGKPTPSKLHVVFKTPLGDAPVGVPLIPVQLYESTFNLVLFFLLMLMEKRHKKYMLPVYMVTYAIGRFTLEYFRYDFVRGSIGHISTSQLISIIIFAVGTALFFFRKKQ